MTPVNTPDTRRVWNGELRNRPMVGYQGRQVVVTGGAGFIGSSLCRVLLAAGARVRVVDDLVNGSLDNLPTGPQGPRCDVVVADVRDADAVAAAVADADVVFHLACLGVRHSLSDPVENFDVNANGSLSVLEAARRARVPRTVQVSTSEVYGTARTAPMTEQHPTEPHTVYGAGKLAGEACARALFRTHGFDTVVIRPFNAYGPRAHAGGDSGEVIPRFIVQALHGDPLYVFGPGTQTRDFTHVHDTAATIAHAGILPGLAGRTFNVGSGHEVRVEDLAHLIRDLTDSTSPIVHVDPRPGDVGRLIADSTAAVRTLGHHPEVRLADGIADLIRRFRDLDGDALAMVAGAVPAQNWPGDPVHPPRVPGSP